MQYRPLGRTGFGVTPIGLGCGPMMSLPIEDGARVVRRALELGINYIDVARSYGQSEIMVGQAMRGWSRQDVFISSKTGARTREEAWRSIGETLERLQTDYLDNCHLHGMRPGEDIAARMGPGGALEALVQAREEGLIRHIGCSGHTSKALLEALQRYPLDIILVPMNIIEREPLDELIPLCHARGVGVTIMKPVAVGFLPARIALKWLLNQPIATAVPGATTVEEVEMDARMAALEDVTLDAQEEAEVAALAERLQTVRCRFCDDCKPCSQGIEIPGLLGGDVMLGHYRVMGPDLFAGTTWSPEYLERDRQAKEKLVAQIEQCDHCGKCEERCPHGLPVMDLLQSVLPALRDMLRAYASQRAS